MLAAIEVHRAPSCVCVSSRSAIRPRTPGPVREDATKRAPPPAEPCGTNPPGVSLAAARAPMMLRPLLAASAVLLIALPARAERPNDAATLDYHPSRASVALCPAADFLALEVQLRLGYELFQPSAPNHLTVKIDRANGRFRAIGEIRDDDGKVTFTRTYSEIDCTATVFTMAIAVSLKFTRPPEEPEPSPPALPPAPSTSAPAPKLPPPLEPKSSLVPSPVAGLQLGVGSSVAFNLSPAILVGPTWFIGARFSNISVALEGRALFAPTVQVDGVPIVPSVVTGSLSACLHYRALFGCGRFELGAFHLNSTAGSNPSPTNALIVGLGPRIGANWSFTNRLALRGYVDLLTVATPIKIRVGNDARPLWASFPLSPSIGAELAISL